MTKKILVTGSKGFIGKTLVTYLKRDGYDIFEYDIDSNPKDLETYIKQADWLINLAGVNRPKDKEEFYEGNTRFIEKLIKLIKENNPKIKIIANSSTQATLDNDYGKSKKLGEELWLKSNLEVYIYRFHNVFGKLCRPNYNSVIATFCYNIAHDLAIEISDENHVVHFNFVDDICEEFQNLIEGKISRNCREILEICPVFDCSLGKLASLLKYFKNEIESDRHLPLLHNEFEFDLFKTFCSYLSDEGYSFNYAKDNRGAFEELYKSKKWGQISDNMAYPGITKGGHYHSYKYEIFYTVIGKSRIRQRNIENDELIVNIVDGNNPELVNIFPKYTHEITNIGDINTHTIMWISEIYSEKTPDSFKEEVIKND